MEFQKALGGFQEPRGRERAGSSGEGTRWGGSRTPGGFSGSAGAAFPAWPARPAQPALSSSEVVPADFFSEEMEELSEDQEADEVTKVGRKTIEDLGQYRIVMTLGKCYKKLFVRVVENIPEAPGEGRGDTGRGISAQRGEDQGLAVSTQG